LKPAELMALHYFTTVSVTIDIPVSTSVLPCNGKNKEDFRGDEE